ncbi:hypothetical protein [Halalkalibacter alkaliphilus]|uniref:Uncharacterized protein n=1 Tax=Halalkalibacter alkaliphilus TaxID=2917993 RepID=A0A9X2CW48_9BACI|nr:hypothetical protein [Halalkalibacter alkaliphilus]MCL7749210.1 hypothetical protein [Halalkalibacter alkaliphilus]
MSFWSKVGLASHNELKEMKEELSMAQNILKKDIQELFQEQKASQDRAIENIHETFKYAVNHLETKNKEDTEQLITQISNLKSKVSSQLQTLNERDEGISAKIDTLQEIVKIHWASTLLDYVDEILDETEVEMKPSKDGTDHPLSYDFGEVSALFKFIYRETERAGFHIGWKNTKQTVQFYLRKEDGESYDNQIGAIQYEGSNDFSKKAPTTVSWRFIIKNMPDTLIRDLSSVLSEEQAFLLVNKSKDVIAFRFQDLEARTKGSITEISEVLSINNLEVAFR